MPTLRGRDGARAQPAGEQVEEVHAVLDEDPAALGPVPEPVLGRQVLVRGVVLERSRAGPRPAPSDWIRRPTASYTGLYRCIRLATTSRSLLPRRRDHGVGLLDRHRQRLLADDVLAGLEGGHRLRMVQERRSGDVDQVDVVAGQELVDVLDVGDAEPPRGGDARPGGACPPCRSASRPGTWANCWRAYSPKPPQPITPTRISPFIHRTPFPMDSSVARRTSARSCRPSRSSRPTRACSGRNGGSIGSSPYQMALR